MPRLSIVITQEDLLDLKADACVCSVHRTRDLRNGVLSRKVAEAAGEDLEKELKSFTPHQELRQGEVREVQPQKLSSKFQLIYFVCLRMWQDGNDHDLQVAIERILDDAGHKGFTTVALPAMGAGGLKYPSEKVAVAILQAAMAYSIDNPKSSVTCVKLSLFEQKDQMLKAFTDILIKGVNVYEDYSQSQPKSTTLDYKSPPHQAGDQNGNPLPVATNTMYAQPALVQHPQQGGKNLVQRLWSYFGRVPPVYTFVVGPVPVGVGPYLNLRRRGLGAEVTIGVTFSLTALPSPIASVLSKICNRT